MNIVLYIIPYPAGSGKSNFRALVADRPSLSLRQIQLPAPSENAVFSAANLPVIVGYHRSALRGDFAAGHYRFLSVSDDPPYGQLTIIAR